MLKVCLSLTTYLSACLCSHNKSNAEYNCSKIKVKWLAAGFLQFRSNVGLVIGPKRRRRMSKYVELIRSKDRCPDQ
jgi:hypothetical protein